MSSSPLQETLFGKSLTPAERLRQHQRSLQKAQRELDREKSKLEAQEKKTMADIKKNAKAGNMVCPLSLCHSEIHFCDRCDDDTGRPLCEEIMGRG
jgi:hypothetical protein